MPITNQFPTGPKIKIGVWSASGKITLAAAYYPTDKDKLTVDGGMTSFPVVKDVNNLAVSVNGVYPWEPWSVVTVSGDNLPDLGDPPDFNNPPVLGSGSGQNGGSFVINIVVTGV